MRSARSHSAPRKLTWAGRVAEGWDVERDRVNGNASATDRDKYRGILGLDYLLSAPNPGDVKVLAFRGYEQRYAYYLAIPLGALVSFAAAKDAPRPVMPTRLPNRKARRAAMRKQKPRK